MAAPIKKDERNIQIGIDIGTHSVKAVSILHASKALELFSFSVRPVMDDVVKAIKDAYAELGVTKRKVVTSIAGPATIVRYVELPSMTKEELSSATRFEAKAIIPYNIDEVILDSTKLENLKENRMRAIIVAAKRDLVDTQIKMLQKAELEPVILDIDSFALMNTFVNATIDKENTCGLINIGAKMSNLNIVKGGLSYLSRDIDIGGNDITRALAEKMSLKEDEAEKIKQERLSQLLQLSPEEKSPVSGVLEEVLMRLINELRLSFDYYESHYAGAVNKIYISGGTARPLWVENFLKENASCPVSKWDPVAGIELSKNIDTNLLDEFKPQLAIAIGLGLRDICQ